ncbi:MULTISPECIES: glycosyl hydrolase family 8 [Lactobacillus]|uniref:glycosyl hydrolase family 8 n=1 Tax=Lactobacillus TaxID=1578 RepID=UPI001EFF95B4|nr:MULTISPECIES: glycosyl hydrolase family 8 [Lactobacillus]
MLISVLAAKKGLTDQKQFQQFYEYYLNHRLPGTQLLSWRQVAGKDADSSATDGDLMVAQALIQAYRLWPQKKEYARQARRLLADILKYEYNAREKILTVGNWATAKSKYYDLMRTSDVMPAVFTQFYQFTGERKWLVIKQKMLKRLDQLSKSNSSGLVPDFAWVKKGKAKPVKANTVATAYDGAYSANACRVPMLLADSQDKLSEQILRRMLSFFSKHVPLASGYTLNGEVINAKTIGSFSAPVFYAVNHYRNQSYDQLFLSEQHHFTDGLPKDNYYDATLICLVALMNEKV